MGGFPKQYKFRPLPTALHLIRFIMFTRGNPISPLTRSRTASVVCTQTCSARGQLAICIRCGRTVLGYPGLSREHINKAQQNGEALLSVRELNSGFCKVRQLHGEHRGDIILSDVSRDTTAAMRLSKRSKCIRVCCCMFRGNIPAGTQQFSLY